MSVLFSGGKKRTPGRSGWFPTQTPHRSVLARLTHTAPRFKLRRRRYPSSFRGHVHGFRGTRHVSLQRSFETASPSLHGVLRSSSPISTLLWDAPTPCRSFRRASLPSLGDTTLASGLLPPAGTRDRGHGELVFRFPSRKCQWKRQGLSGSRATLMSLRPVLGRKLVSVLFSEGGNWCQFFFRRQKKELIPISLFMIKPETGPLKQNPSIGIHYPIDAIFTPNGVLKIPDGTRVWFMMRDTTNYEWYYMWTWHGIVAPTWYPAGTPNPFGDNPLDPTDDDLYKVAT